AAGGLGRGFRANGPSAARGPTGKTAAARAAGVDLPISVEAAIEARIAALAPEERDLLEKGAVFGNVFWVSAVVAMTRLEREEPPEKGKPPPVPPPEGWADDPLKVDIVRRIDRLVERDYLLLLPAHDSSVPGAIEAAFKHNLE